MVCVSDVVVWVVSYCVVRVDDAVDVDCVECQEGERVVFHGGVLCAKVEVVACSWKVWLVEYCGSSVRVRG